MFLIKDNECTQDVTIVRLHSIYDTERNVLEDKCKTSFQSIWNPPKKLISMHGEIIIEITLSFFF